MTTTDQVNTSGSPKLANAEEILLGPQSEDLHADPSAASRLLVCSLFEDQRPLRGVAGGLDWRLRGFLSKFLISGRIAGSQGELIYVPIRRYGSVRHLLLVGLGSSKTVEELDSKKLLTALSQSITSLGFKEVAISRSSFSFWPEDEIKKTLKNIEVEFIQ
ncbi:MAG: M17 family peptidase N-terminal domain-containing protein [Bdellovibrionota bacterium]